ncbi:unnamed protein product, partial [Rotaria sordida]
MKMCAVQYLIYIYFIFLLLNKSIKVCFVFTYYSYSSGIQTPGRHVRTRLYFTSESHVHSLLTVIRYGGLLDV